MILGRVIELRIAKNFQLIQDAKIECTNLLEKAQTECLHLQAESASYRESLNIYRQIYENIPVNVMVAGRDTKISMLNPASLKTLKSIEHLLPMPVSKIQGASYDLFHKNPAIQRRLLDDPKNLPHKAQIELSGEFLNLEMTALYDLSGEFVGPMVTWSVVSDKINLAKRNEETKDNLKSTVLSLVTETSQASGELSTYITGVVTAIDQMNSSIQEIAECASRAADMTKNTVQESQMVQELIVGLEVCSKEIGDIIKVVNSISNQINLLALNATIEAARAGDAGKGFAVVANEVKALAGQTSEATKGIQKKIDAIQVQTKDALNLVGVTSTSVRSISDTVISIAAAIEEQTTVSNEIARNMTQANSRIDIVAESIDHITESVEHNIALMG